MRLYKRLFLSIRSKDEAGLIDAYSSVPLVQTDPPKALKLSQKVAIVTRHALQLGNASKDGQNPSFTLLPNDLYLGVSRAGLISSTVLGGLQDGRRSAPFSSPTQGSRWKSKGTS